LSITGGKRKAPGAEWTCPLLAYRPSLGLIKQVAQLSQTDHAAGWVSYGKKWKTGTGKLTNPNFNNADFQSIFAHNASAVPLSEKKFN